MHKKPMLTAIVLVACAMAFAAIPTAAQAEAHWYVDGVKAAEGKTFPSLSWGTLTLTNSNPAIAPVTCENAVLGEYRNPTGGGGGESETDLFATANCADAECPEEDGLEVQVHSEGLPRPTEAFEAGTVEEGPKTFIVTPENVFVVGCYEAHSSTLVAAPTTCNGISGPEFQNGAGNLSQVVSKVRFTGQDAYLECTTSTEEVTEGVMSKSLNTMAYGSPVPTKQVGPLTANTGQATLEAKTGGPEVEQPPLVLEDGGVKVTVTKRANRGLRGCSFKKVGDVCTIEIENKENGTPPRTLTVTSEGVTPLVGEGTTNYFSLKKTAKSCSPIPNPGTCTVEIELSKAQGGFFVFARYFVKMENSAVIREVKFSLVA